MINKAESRESKTQQQLGVMDMVNYDDNGLHIVHNHGDSSLGVNSLLFSCCYFAVGDAVLCSCYVSLSSWRTVLIQWSAAVTAC